MSAHLTFKLFYDCVFPIQISGVCHIFVICYVRHFITLPTFVRFCFV